MLHSMQYALDSMQYVKYICPVILVQSKWGKVNERYDTTYFSVQITLSKGGAILSRISRKIITGVLYHNIISYHFRGALARIKVGLTMAMLFLVLISKVTNIVF